MTAVARIRPLVLLATGGMAEIWLARLEGAEQFQRPLVVKRAYPTPDARSALIDEATLLSHLPHPNLVHAYALVEDSDGLLLAMEHLSGTSLRALLDHLRRDDLLLPPSLSARIVADAARGLDYAHRATLPNGTPLSVVHGDISPENLVVTEIGLTKVIDFGV